ncbi:Single-minded like protein 2 [Chelonia mydas]|uniref:Single-minded like protein 2 n=1 Tax=Chelonia mydas TaxID=8469 RepID=M7BHZ0_CHEMY|nr:Single-minded like protein 2 [Chelonia mydas]
MKCVLAKRNAGLTCSGYKVIHCSGYLKIRQYMLDMSLYDSCYQIVGLVAVGQSLPPSAITEIKLHSNMFMFRASLDLKLIFLDSRVTDLTGYEPQDLIEKTLYHHVHGCDVFHLRYAHHLLLVKGQVTTKYYRLLSKHGGWVWVQSYATIVHNSRSSRPHCIVSVNYVLTDIEYKELQLSLDQVTISKSQFSCRNSMSTSQETRRVAKPKSNKMKAKLRMTPYPQQQYSSFQTDKLECGQVGSWRSSPTANAGTIQEQNFHSENSELLYAPSYSLPFSYHYGHFPVDSHVFSSKKQMLTSKFGQSQGSPCEVARFFLSTLQTSGERQWHYANSLVPASQSPSKNLPDQPMNIARHNLAQSYEVPIPNRRYSQDATSDSFPSCATSMPNSRYKEEIYNSSIMKPNKMESRIHPSHHLIKEENKLAFSRDLQEKVCVNEKSFSNSIANSLLPKSECFQAKAIGQLSHLLPVPTVYEQTRRICMKEPKYGHINHHAMNLDELDNDDRMTVKLDHDSENEHVMDTRTTGQVPFVFLNYHHVLAKHVPIPNRRYSQDATSDSFPSCATSMPNSRYKEEIYNSSIMKPNKMESRIHPSHHLIKEENKLAFSRDLQEKVCVNEKSFSNSIANSLLPKSECFQAKAIGQLSHLLPVPTVYEQTRRICMKEPKYGHINHHAMNLDELDNDDRMTVKLDHDSENEHVMDTRTTGQVPFVFLNYHHVLAKHGTFQTSSCTATGHVAENYGYTSEEVNTFIYKNQSPSSASSPETHKETALPHYIGTSVIIANGR